MCDSALHLMLVCHIFKLLRGINLDILYSLIVKFCHQVKENISDLNCVVALGHFQVSS